MVWKEFRTVGDRMEAIELWDGYYADGTLAGIDLVRGEPVPEGIYHGVVEVFVHHEDGSILLMRRDLDKPNYPGYWESGAGGALLKGETFLEGAIRELEEETGIVTSKLNPIYRIVNKCRIYQGYECTVGIDKRQIRLQRGETIDFKWLNKKEFLDFYHSGELARSLKERIKNYVDHDFKVSSDCGFERGNQWFRYRAAAIIIENDSVLMARNEIDDYYYSIGGGVHFGETAENAVIREVQEETGVEYEIDHLAFINECFFNGDGTLNEKECHVIEFYFLMKSKGKQEVHSSSMTQGVREHMCWIPLKEIDQHKAFPLFFKEELTKIDHKIKHFVSDERSKVKI